MAFWIMKIKIKPMMHYTYKKIYVGKTFFCDTSYQWHLIVFIYLFILWWLYYCYICFNSTK